MQHAMYFEPAWTPKRRLWDSIRWSMNLTMWTLIVQPYVLAICGGRLPQAHLDLVALMASPQLQLSVSKNQILIRMKPLELWNGRISFCRNMMYSFMILPKKLFPQSIRLLQLERSLMTTVVILILSHLATMMAMLVNVNSLSLRKQWEGGNIVYNANGEIIGVLCRLCCTLSCSRQRTSPTRFGSLSSVMWLNLIFAVSWSNLTMIKLAKLFWPLPRHCGHIFWQRVVWTLIYMQALWFGLDFNHGSWKAPRLCQMETSFVFSFLIQPLFQAGYLMTGPLLAPLAVKTLMQSKPKITIRNRRVTLISIPIMNGSLCFKKLRTPVRMSSCSPSMGWRKCHVEPGRYNLQGLHQTLWFEQSANSSPRIHMVHPQPSDDATSTHVLAEFCRPATQMNPLLIPVVEDLQQYDQVTLTHEYREATYKLSPITYDLMMQPHQHRCPRDGGHRCMVWCRALPLVNGGQASLHRGDLVTIRIFPESASSNPLIGHIETMYEQIVGAVHGSPLSSINLYFHTIDGRSSTYSVSGFHPGLLTDIAAHAEYLWGPDAWVQIGTITSHSPHNFHFVIGPQGGDGQIALTAVSTTNDEGQPLCAFQAVVLPRWCSATDLAAQLNLLDAIGRFSELTYNAQAWSGAPIQLNGPTFIEVTVPFEYFVMGDNVVVGDESESDVSSLMQSSSSSVPTDSTITVTLRGLHRRLHVLELPLGQSLFDYLDQNWPFQALAHSDMVALHAVESPPSYVNRAREQMFLVECDTDRFEQVHEDDVLILVTIKYFIPGTTWENDKVRTKVAWCPKRSSREGIMHYLRMQWFCQRPTITCELFFNELEWGPLDSVIRHFQSGDHLRLNILSTKERWCEFEYSEQADRGRLFFESSPSEPRERREEAEEAEEESLSPYTVQERSRSRTRSRSLLQTVVTARRTSPSMPRKQTQIVSLADKIQPPVWVRIPCNEVRFLHTQLLDVDLGPILDRRQVVKWHSATLDAFESTPDWNGETVEKYCFYTDGSSIRTDNGRAGSSAVVLIVLTSSGPRFGGIRAYTVPTMATAPRTEALAMLFGLLWAHQLGHMHPSTTSFKVEFGYDCLMAGHVAAGQWSIRSNQDIQIHSRALTQWMVQKYGDCVRFHHIASHTGHPWNECADAVTWSVVNQWMGSLLPTDVLQQLTADGRAEHLSSWLWLYEAALRGDPHGPVVAEDHFVYNVAAPFESEPIGQCHPLPTRQQQESPALLRTTTEVSLVVATANVLTLYPGGERPGSYVSARQEQLMRQCIQAGLHVVGVQESRSKVEGYRETEDYHILSAPATAAGVGGVQVWVARRFEFGDKHFPVSHRHLRVLHATTQRMVVAFCAPWLKILFVVGHAPSVVDDQMRRWWHSLPRIIPPAYRAWPTIYMLDAMPG